MTGELVLLTGTTGFVGFATLRCALRHGYKVRAAVRSEAKAEAVRNNPTLKDVKPGQLSFVVVPDFLEDGAFDEAIKDCKYVIHVASPTPLDEWTGDDDLETLLVKPAVQGTLGVLESAKKAGTVTRISITSSAVALIPLAVFTGAPATEPIKPDTHNDDIPAPYMKNVMVAYMASKIAALNRAEAWVAKEQPTFDLIHINPPFVFGRDDMTRSLADFQKGTNSMLLEPVLGKEAEPRIAAMVHVEDVALSHVLSLDLAKVQGNQRFLLSNNGTEGVEFDHAKDFAKKHFPEAVEQGVLPCSTSVVSNPFAADTSKTEKLLGRKLKTFEDMVVSVVGHYLEVLEKEKSRQ